MTDVEVVPPELAAAAVPLREVADLLRSLAEDRMGLERFGAGSPSALLRSALSGFVERWELLLWDVSGEAAALADALRRAAEDYVGTEQDLARRLSAPVGGGGR